MHVEGTPAMCLMRRLGRGEQGRGPPPPPGQTDDAGGLHTPLNAQSPGQPPLSSKAPTPE